MKKIKDKYTRSDAFVDVLPKLKQKGKTRKELIDQANKIYIKNGGSDNIKNSNTWFGVIMPSFIHELIKSI